MNQAAILDTHEACADINGRERVAVWQRSVILTVLTLPSNRPRESTMRRHFVLTLIGLAVMMMLGLNASTLGAQEVNAPIGFDALTLTLEIPGGRRFLSLEPIPVRPDAREPDGATDFRSRRSQVLQRTGTAARPTGRLGSLSR